MQTQSIHPTSDARGVPFLTRCVNSHRVKNQQPNPSKWNSYSFLCCERSVLGVLYHWINSPLKISLNWSKHLWHIHLNVSISYFIIWMEIRTQSIKSHHFNTIYFVKIKWTIWIWSVYLNKFCLEFWRMLFHSAIAEIHLSWRLTVWLFKFFQPMILKLGPIEGKAWRELQFSSTSRINGIQFEWTAYLKRCLKFMIYSDSNLIYMFIFILASPFRWSSWLE